MYGSIASPARDLKTTRDFREYSCSVFYYPHRDGSSYRITTFAGVAAFIRKVKAREYRFPVPEILLAIIASPATSCFAKRETIV